MTPLKRKREIDEGAASYKAGEVSMSARRRVFLAKDVHQACRVRANHYTGCAGGPAKYVS